MKLGCRDIRLKVSRRSSRVSPRAGATRSRGVEGVFSESVSTVVGPSRGVPEGVPGRGEAPLLPIAKEVGLVPGGGASRSIVNAKKSSCCSLSSLRIVSSIVEMVRRVVWRTCGLSDLASWKRNLHPWSRTRADNEGKSHILVPETSNATFRIRSAVRRVESVCA